MSNAGCSLSDRHGGRCWLSLLACALLSGTVGAQTPLGRATTNRHDDLIAACLAEERLDAAQAICQRYLRSTAPGSWERARWAIRLSSVGVARLRARGEEDDSLWEAARQPIETALAGYESQPAAPWLELQSRLVGLAQAELRLMLALSNPADAALRERFERGLRDTLRGLETLDRKLADLLPLAPDLQREATSAGLAHRDDLLLLQRALRRQQTAGMLLRTRLYEPGSTDALAAATEAERAAQQLLDSLPADAPQRGEVVRMLARAKRLAAEPAEAAALLAGAVAAGGASPETVAEWLRAEMDRGNYDRVRQWLAGYFGTSPTEAGATDPHLELDLARLQFLIGELQRNSDGQPRASEPQVTAWVEAIAERHGAHGRRRAEAIMLRDLTARPDRGNRALLTAQADQWVRAGEPEAMKRAAELYEQAAALARGDGAQEEAYRLGARAGACLVKAGQPLRAVDRLAETARRAADREGAGALHLQAALLLAQQLGERRTEEGTAEDPRALAVLVDRLVTLLVDQLTTWPLSDEALRAREMAMQMLDAAGRPTAAAVISLHLPADSVLWEQAVRRAGAWLREGLGAREPGASRARYGGVVVQMLGRLLDGQPPELPAEFSADAETVAAVLPTLRVAQTPGAALLREERALLAALSLSREALGGVWIDAPQSARVGDESPLSFAHDLRRVRVDSINPASLALTPPATSDRAPLALAAIERLHVDGVEDPSFRQLAAAAILRIAESVAPADQPGQRQRWSLLRGDALAWSGQWQQARDLFRELAAGPPTDGAALRHGAATLAALEDRDAVIASIEMWNRFAAGVPQGSADWHAAKLATAEAMARAGQASEASRLARYVLLTTPPDDAELKARYERFAQPPP